MYVSALLYVCSMQGVSISSDSWCFCKVTLVDACKHACTHMQSCICKWCDCVLGCSDMSFVVHCAQLDSSSDSMIYGFVDNMWQHSKSSLQCETRPKTKLWYTLWDVESVRYGICHILLTLLDKYSRQDATPMKIVVEWLTETFVLDFLHYLLIFLHVCILGQVLGASTTEVRTRKNLTVSSLFCIKMNFMDGFFLGSGTCRSKTPPLKVHLN